MAESMQKMLSSQQAVLSEIILKLARLEKQPSLPPLLPTPPSPLPVTIGSSHTNPEGCCTNQPSDLPQSSSPHLPKLEIPLFMGDNVLGWIFQIENFFAYHQTPADQKLEIAAFYMAGPALMWF